MEQEKKTERETRDEEEKWVNDSSVDYKGKVPLRASTGVWKASLFVIGKSTTSTFDCFSVSYFFFFFFFFLAAAAWAFLFHILVLTRVFLITNPFEKSVNTPFILLLQFWLSCLIWNFFCKTFYFTLLVGSLIYDCNSFVLSVMKF